ncbi:MAG TPA: DUF554 family protein [Verrucomicrobiae bacterium]|nr:DUF554 family protein [Verrucomicrobiae bacterium]
MPIAIGAFLNAAGILFGGLFGLTWRNPISPRVQLFFRNTLGLATIFCGLFLIYQNISGTFLACAKQIFLALLAMILGNLIGKLLGLQKISNRLGRIAGNSIAEAQKHSAQNVITGLNACTILFCAAPLGILGAIVDGLSNYFYLLAIKAVMDGLATTSFVKMFRWPAALSAIPVFAFLNAIALACQIYARPFLDAHHLTGSVSTTAGFVALAISVVIFEVRKVQLANYLPALAIAPLLTWLLHH